jgi:tetratricopeptide (TPR) repeat protein
VKNVGHCYLNLYEFQSAIKFYKIALEISQSLYGNMNLKTSECYFNLGVAYENNNENRNSLVSFKNSFKIRKALRGENDKNVKLVQSIIERLENDGEN